MRWFRLILLCILLILLALFIWKREPLRHIQQPHKETIHSDQTASPAPNNRHETPLFGEGISSYSFRDIPPEKSSSSPSVNLAPLKKYEGSYTMEDLRRKREEGPDNIAFNIKTSWFIRNPNAPQAGLSVRLNPTTGNHEVVGGEFFLPASGLGISQERNDITGENRTFLNLKKSF